MYGRVYIHSTYIHVHWVATVHQNNCTHALSMHICLDLIVPTFLCKVTYMYFAFLMPPQVNFITFIIRQRHICKYLLWIALLHVYRKCYWWCWIRRRAVQYRNTEVSSQYRIRRTITVTTNAYVPHHVPYIMQSATVTPIEVFLCVGISYM